MRPQNTDRENQWSFLQLRFRDGFHQVVIQGIRPDSNESSGVALDDIYLAPCDKLRKYYNDVIMSVMASQITGVSIVCSTVA